MHKSRLAGLIIDCETDDLDEATKFWSKALGNDAVASTDPAEENYVALDTRPGEPYVELQRVSHPSRVHIDIEADDVDAEVARLERLGAKRIEKIRTWWVMEAPTGHRFCVVTAQRAGFEESANSWGDS